MIAQPGRAGDCSTRIVYVGETTPEGALASREWAGVCDSASEWIDEILVFCSEKMVIQPIVERTGVVPSAEPFPDPDAPLLGHRFVVSGDEARAVLSVLRFDASVLVTHLFLLQRGSGTGSLRLVGELEAGDGAQFVVLRLSKAEETALVARLEPLDASICVCEEWRAVVDGLVEEGESWLPLGR